MVMIILDSVINSDEVGPVCPVTSEHGRQGYLCPAVLERRVGAMETVNVAQCRMYANGDWSALCPVWGVRLTCLVECRHGVFSLPEQYIQLSNS